MGCLQFVMGIVLKAQGESERSSAAVAKAKGLGINTEKLQGEDPKMWSRVLLSFENSQP